MSLAPFVPSSTEVVRAMLQIAQLLPGETLYDLGCGDGRIVVMAAQEFGAKAIGVEMDNERYRDCVNKIRELRLKDRVKIVHDDFLNVNLSNADVVTLYLLPDANEKLKPILKRDLKKGARVVSHDFMIDGWEPEKEQHNPTIYLYRKLRTGFKKTPPYGGSTIG